MTVYAVANSKGGAGKSFVAAHLADELARHGRRVVLLELDRQGDSSTWLGVDDDTPVSAVAADVLAGDASLTEAATDSQRDGIAVVCGTKRLGIEYGPSVLGRVRDVVREGAHGWDDVVIDTAPAINGVTSAALIAAEVVVVPCKTDAATWRQVDELSAHLAAEVSDYRPGAQVDFIVPLAVDTRETLPRAIEDDLRERYGQKVTPRVRAAAAVQWAWLDGQVITQHAPSSGVAFDVRAAMSYVITQHRATTEGK